MSKKQQQPLPLTEADAEIIIEALMPLFLESETTFSWRTRIYVLIQLFATNYGIDKNKLDELFSIAQDITPDCKECRARAQARTQPVVSGGMLA